MYQRKLLGYERNFYARPTRHHKSNELQREIIAAKGLRLTERKRDIARDIEPTNNKDKGEMGHFDLSDNIFSKKK